jgi:hypothetical protein
MSEAKVGAVPGSFKERGLKLSIIHPKGSPDGHGASEPIGPYFTPAVSLVVSVSFHNTQKFTSNICMKGNWPHKSDQAHWPLVEAVISSVIVMFFSQAQCLGRQSLWWPQWPVSWNSCHCAVPSTWGKAALEHSLLKNTKCQRFWVATDSISYQKAYALGLFPPFICILLYVFPWGKQAAMRATW